MLKAPSDSKVRQRKDHQSRGNTAATVREQYGGGEPLRDQNAASDCLGLQNARHDIPGVHIPNFSEDPRVEGSWTQGNYVAELYCAIGCVG